MKVFVLHIDHRFGSTIEAFDSYEGARGAVYDFVAQQWSEVQSSQWEATEDDPKALDAMTQAEAIDYYFNIMEEVDQEWYEIVEVDLVQSIAQLRKRAAELHMMLVSQMVSDISDHKLEVLTHEQLINLVKDMRNEARAANKEHQNAIIVQA